MAAADKVSERAGGGGTRIPNQVLEGGDGGDRAHRLQPFKRGYMYSSYLTIKYIIKYQNDLMRYLVGISPLPSILAKTSRSLGAARSHLLEALPNDSPKLSPPSFPRDARN